MEKQVFAPGCYHCLQSEHGPIVETLVKANAGCAVAEINQAKVAHQFKKLIPVFLIHGNLGHYGDGTVVEVGSFGHGRHRRRQRRLYVKRLDEIKR
jgi:hypothetical protein